MEMTDRGNSWVENKNTNFGQIDDKILNLKHCHLHLAQIGSMS